MKYSFASIDGKSFELTEGNIGNESRSNTSERRKTSGIRASQDDGGRGGGPGPNTTRRSFSSGPPSSSGRTSSSFGSYSSFNFGDVDEENVLRTIEAEKGPAANLIAESRQSQSQRGSAPTHGQETQPEIQQEDTLAMEQYSSPPGAATGGGRGGSAQLPPAVAPSSPEISAGSSGASGNGNGGNGSGRQQPRLVVIRQPPTHVVPNEWFEAEIGLEFPPASTPPSAEAASGQRGQGQGQSHGLGTIGFVPYLHIHDPPEMGPSVESVSSGARLDVGGQGVVRVPLEPASPRKPASQRRVQVPDKAKDPLRSSTKVLLKIDTNIRQDRLLRYSIKFAARPGQNLPATVSSIQSQTIITRPIAMVSARFKVEPIDWDPTWYKDEGGREKCMQVRVSLSDKNGDPVSGRKIPLKFTLLYDNGQSLRVMNQGILKVFGSDRQYINPNGSAAIISFRIEDVSKNHQGMAFKLEIAPDSPRTASDIAPGFSPPVSIRSKRNKRQRSSGSSFGGARTGSAGSESFRDLNATAMSSSAASVVSTAGAAIPPQQQQQQQQQQAVSMAGVGDIQALRTAMRGVIRWTEEVVNGLFPLKWQVIGYAQFPDGTVDYNRPYHSMPNPNECIQRVLSMYSDETRENLRTLLEAVENTTAAQVDQGPSGPRTTSTASATGTAGATANATTSSTSPIARAAASRSAMAMQPYSPYNAPPPGRTYYPSPPDQGAPWQHLQQPHFAYPPPPYPIQHGSSPIAMPHPTNGSFFPPDSTGNVPGNAAAKSGSSYRPQSSGASSRQSSVGIVEPATTSDRDEPTRDEIFYILAKPFKSVSTGEKLGFPSYNAEREMIGFVRESNQKGFGQFAPITNYSAEFGATEMSQATRILEGAIANQNPALHSREMHTSVYSLIDHALVYDFSRKESSRKG
mmetsp:Transcript_27913/g.80652  ORF Transcript_27913/g.80652 Transcript_27913/m.80652 type:complete len:914 (-) Transcript_27913:123-2864(-)